MLKLVINRYVCRDVVSGYRWFSRLRKNNRLDNQFKSFIQKNSAFNGVVVRNNSTLIVSKCALFTIVSVNAVFIGSVIWSYENWKDLAKPRIRPLREKFRKKFISIFGRPFKETDIFLVLCVANILVFLGNNSSMSATFMKYFTNSPFGATPALSMLLSIFSHQSMLHLFVNMYVLHNFTTPLVRSLGMEQFFALYISGGIFSGFLSVCAKVLQANPVASIGASGAVCAGLSAFCLLEPDSRLCVPFLVELIPHSFRAGSAAYIMVAMETLALLVAKKSPIDHAAHLGGLLFGMWYVLSGKDLIASHRFKIIDFWKMVSGHKKDR